MSRYRRRSYYNQSYGPVNVSVHWDNLSNASYLVKFDNIGSHWDKVSVIIDFIKTTVPSSQREYDSDTKTWFIGESYIKSILDTLNAIPDFSISYIEKPEQVQAQKFHSKEDDFKRWKQLLSMAHVSIPDGEIILSDAIKYYRRGAMYLHPDRNPAMADEMSELNEVWNRLKGGYFKDASTVSSN